MFTIGDSPVRVRRLHVVDSPKRCPFDGKRMVMEIATEASGETRTVHQCVHCLYSEEE